MDRPASDPAMSLRRFFIEPDRIKGASAELTGSEAHHIHTVLRLTIGEEVVLLDGQGGRHQAILENIRKSRVLARILTSQNEPQPLVRLHLGQGLLKGERMDFAIQKATELGVESIRPFFSEQGIPRSKQGHRLERWRRIVLESCKQCDRSLVPQVLPTSELDQLLTEPPKVDLKLIFFEEEKEQSLDAIQSLACQVQSVFFLLGPVGGFSAKEIALAKSQGFLSLSLGPRILRAETATIAATAILQYLFGNLRPTSPAGS